MRSSHASGEEALRHLPDNRPDVVLVDINLLGMSGIDCIRRHKEITPSANCAGRFRNRPVPLALEP